MGADTETLDSFFAPYNEPLYAWAALHGVPFKRWENASHAATEQLPHTQT